MWFGTVKIQEWTLEINLVFEDRVRQEWLTPSRAWVEREHTHAPCCCYCCAFGEGGRFNGGVTRQKGEAISEGCWRLRLRFSGGDQTGSRGCLREHKNFSCCLSEVYKKGSLSSSSSFSSPPPPSPSTPFSSSFSSPFLSARYPLSPSLFRPPSAPPTPHASSCVWPIVLCSNIKILLSMIMGMKLRKLEGQRTS